MHIKTSSFLMVTIVILLAAEGHSYSYRGEGSAYGELKEMKTESSGSGFRNLYMSLRYGWQDDDEEAVDAGHSGSGKGSYL